MDTFMLKPCVRVGRVARLIFFIFLFIMINKCARVQSNAGHSEITFDKLYNEGVQAYLEDNYGACVKFLNEALENYKYYVDTLVRSRAMCHDKTSSSESLTLDAKDFQDLQFFEKIVKNTLCLMKRNKLKFVNRTQESIKQVINEFEAMKPYEYLQLCYYQNNDPQRAASAAFTFLVHNPNHEMMMNNFKQYFSMPQVNTRAIVNYESKDYMEKYLQGSSAYRDEQYKKVSGLMEESLYGYLQEEENCRLLCEGPFDQGWFPDFIASVANHFTYCLKCKRRCPEKLNNINGEPHHDLLASHYHYLQFAYFKLNELEKACEAAASYLLFFPDDETMVKNKEFYMQLPGVDESYFKPREEAVRYMKRQHYEKLILKFIEENFTFEDDVKEATGKGKLCSRPETPHSKHRSLWMEEPDSEDVFCPAA